MSESLTRHHAVVGLLTRSHGQAMPLVVACMAVFSISIGSVMVYASGSQKQTDTQRKGSYANTAAEAALATAISVLSTSTEANVTNPNLIGKCNVARDSRPGQPLAFAKAKAYYCGDYDSATFTWNLSATGVPYHISADTGAVAEKTITQKAVLCSLACGGLGDLWNRILQSDDSKCVEFKKMILTIPVVAAGCLKLTGDDAHPSRLIGSSVTVGGKLEMKDSDSIGLPGPPAVPIPLANIGGNCKTEHGPPEHPAPCGPADRVWAVNSGTTIDLTKPVLDYATAYASARPGPASGAGCTPGKGTGGLGTGMKFDKNFTYNKDNDPQQITPSGVSYDCQYWAGSPSQMVGQLKWDAVEQVLTVYGNVFFDGEVKITAPGHSKACAKADHGPYCDKSFSYNGFGTIWTSKRFDLEAGLCSGGDGGNDCETNPSSWDPAQNLLILITGGLLNPGDEGFKMDKDEAVFQGAVYSNGKCKISKKASFSAPLICGQLGIKEDDTLDDPTVNPWPDSLIHRTGDIWTSPNGLLHLVLLPQLGG
jgi:hypothetical protein